MRPRPSSRVGVLLLSLAISAIDRGAIAQPPGAGAASETDPIVLDFGSQNASRKASFLSEEFALELEVSLPLRTEKRELRAKLPGPGTFELKRDPLAELVESGEPQYIGREARVEVRTKLPSLTPQSLRVQVDEVVNRVLAGRIEQATTEADGKKKEELTSYFTGLGIRVPDSDAKLKEQYVARRARFLGTAELLAALQELAQQRPQWISPAEQQKWKSLKGQQLAETYENWLKLDLGEKYLRACGLNLDTTKRGFETLIQARLEGLYALRTGNTSSEDRSRANIRPLPPEDLSRLRRAFTFTAVCRFVPASDPGDPNSSWLGGQRVSCQFEGISSRIVSGRLDATRHDAADWWFLQDYDPQQVRLSFHGNDQVLYELFQDGRHGRLHVSSLSSEKQSYRFELTPLRDAGQGPSVRVEESTTQSAPRFPF